MALLSLYPAADIWHILALLPACLPLLAYGLERFWQAPGAQGRAAGGWRLGAGAAIAGFVLVLLFPAVHDVVRARGIAPAFKQSLPRATGIRGGSGLYMSTRSGGKLVRFLMQEPQRDEALFILSAKSLFYFLADRVSPVQEYEYILYLVAADLIREEPARKLVDQDELAMICALRNPKGDAFGPGMATTLFRLTTKRDRRWLLRFWENGSSARDLKTKVKERLGTVADVKGGRKPTQPTSRSDAIRQLHDRCSNWLGWYELLADEEEGDVSVDELPAPIQKQLQATMRAVKKLQDLTTQGE